MCSHDANHCDTQVQKTVGFFPSFFSIFEISCKDHRLFLNWRNKTPLPLNEELTWKKPELSHGFQHLCWKHLETFWLSKKRKDFKIAIWRLNGWLLWTVFCHCRTSLEGLLEQDQTVTAASSPVHQSFENISIRTIRTCTVIMFRCLFLHNTFSYKITVLKNWSAWWKFLVKKWVEKSPKMKNVP